MNLCRMKSGRVLVFPALACGALAASTLIAGCGNNYRPVVTPVYGSGPQVQPTSYAVAISGSTPTAPGEATIIDYSGDSILAEAPVGVGPRAFTMDEAAAIGYTLNSDHTITNFPISSNLQPKLETVTTLPANAQPLNLYSPARNLWTGDLSNDSADIFTGSPQTLQLSVPLAPASTPVFIAGGPTSNTQRQYVISQNLAGANGMTCNTNPTAGPLGAATPIETSNSTLDVPIPVGRCPVFAVESSDLRRLFVLNRGDDTITVINSETNALDNDCPPPSGCVNQNGQTYFSHPVLPLSTTAVAATGVTPPNGTAGMGAVAGPVYAEYNQATSQLVVADYDGGAISVIDVSLDQYGNDSKTFGTTYTIPVGVTATPEPASVTVLADGSKAYTANQGDDNGSGNGTVSVVNLSSHTVEKTLSVEGHPRTVVSTQNSGYAKVYVASPDSPYLTIIESTPSSTDVVDTTVPVEGGNVLDVRVTTQTGGPQTWTTYNGADAIANTNYSSRIPGYGQPCYLPPALLGAAPSLAQCQAIPAVP